MMNGKHNRLLVSILVGFLILGLVAAYIPLFFAGSQ